MHFVLVEPNAPPANIQGHNTSSISIWVDWETVPVAYQNGIIQACACSSKSEKAERAEGFAQIVECAAVVSKHSSAILLMDG